ncbi:type III glutamate--ammonia ligase [uncultured Piscinibacter sp.]|uniref:type III glutamate--ammonia ligase n=1 Tax=uncultured Piscinibacter sp. TaxID=1131835 RepID=UPI002639177D|nr:type III glutamate--ammonia ligase [uncultured Piscinibacter sp.]
MSGHHNVETLRETLAAQGVHTLIAQFTDLHGVAKGKYVPLDQLRTLVETGAGFSGPSITGTGLPRMGPRSEYYGRGDPGSARALPWMPGYARLACDGFVDGQPFDGCPRQVLRRQIARLAGHGWTLQTGIEPEFFLLRRTESAVVPADAQDRLDKPSYDLKSLSRQREFLHELATGLQACGLQVFQIDHEDAHGQYELNFLHADALASADHLMLFKLAAHTLAERHGMLFSMMPKPFGNQPGSGMHFHASLWSGERCLFEGDEGEATMRHFVGGVLAHSAGLAALAAPTVNSYKRLVVGESLSGTSWAPACVAHGPNNRTALVRTLGGRFEWRLPDASANPYLATAGLIAAGLDGIARRTDSGPACTDDLFEQPLSALRARGIALLPQHLGEAVDALEADGVLCDALGETLAREFVHAKRSEWISYARHVSEWEMRRYVDLF